MKTVLITGVNGFIGSSIARALARTNQYQIIGVGTRTCFSGGLELDMHYTKANIANLDEVKEALNHYKNIDVFIHAAASLNKENLSEELVYSNCLGTQNCVRIAHMFNCQRFVYISSVPVIGKPLTLPIDESHPTAPLSTYHASKLFGEHIVLLKENAALQPIVLRIPAPIGVGMNPKTILPIFLEKCKNNETITLFGNGGRKQNYIDVRDICQAVLATLITTTSGVFNIAAEKCISNLELAELCKEVTRSSNEIVMNGKVDPEEDFYWNISIERAKSLLGFRPKYELFSTIQQMLGESVGGE